MLGLHILNIIINFLNPPKCIYCHTQLMDNMGLCFDCWAKAQLISAPICDITGTPLPYDDTSFGEALYSLEAIHHPPTYDKARIAVKFNAISQRLIHQLKYQDQGHLAPLLAKMIHNAARDIIPENKDDAVICAVPLYHWRYVSRRFNQADLLAKNISKLSEIAYLPKLVTRKKATKTQVGLKRDERKKNVAHAFKVNEKWVKHAANKTIFIVDDVVTTGATVDEIAKCLKGAGLGPIYTLAFAKVIQLKVI